MGVMYERARLVAVDDDALFLEVIEAVVAFDSRFELTGTAANGRDGVELVSELRPDIVLMDIEMPILDGIEATRRIAASWPEIAVVVVSGSSERAHETAEAGAAAFVPKERIALELGAVLSGSLRRPCEMAATG